MNLPNILTLARCVLARFSSCSVFDHVRAMVACVLFAVATITDYYDGKTASRIITNCKLLDPVADKILMVAGFIISCACRTCLFRLGRNRHTGAECLITGARSPASTALSPGKRLGQTAIQMTYVHNWPWSFCGVSCAAPLSALLQTGTYEGLSTCR